MIKNRYFEFNAEQNALLQRERGVSFEQMITLMDAGHIVEVRPHHDRKKYPTQYIIEVDTEDYIYLLPCLITDEKIFLKAIYPSRKATKKHKKGKRND